MKIILILIMLTLVAAPQILANSGETYNSLSSVKVITAEEISNSGLTRVGDILLLADEWIINTLDGYDWRASINGLSSFQKQTWVIMLDGQRMDFNSFDIKNLNMLPVSIDQIDSVEIVNLPQIYNGEFTDSGLLHIHTTKPAVGFSFRGCGLAGNETGDPGPYKYTEFTTPNVDRIGKDGALSLACRHKNYYARIGVIFQEHIYTDFAMRRRIHSSTEAGWGHKDRISPYLKFGIETKKLKNEIFIGISNTQKDFLFFKPFGREVPVNNLFSHFGINGNFNINTSNNIFYRLKYSMHELQKRANVFDLDFNWKLNNLSANLEYDYKNHFLRSKIGIGFDRYNLDTDYYLNKYSYFLNRIYGDLSYQLSGRIYQNIGIMVTFAENKIGFKTVLTNYWKFNSAHFFKTILSLSQKLFEEDNSLWYWTERGYDLLKNQNIDYTIRGNFKKANQFTCDLIWSSKYGDFTMEIAGCYRFFKNLYLEKQAFQFNSYYCSCYASTEVHPKNNGQIMGGQVSLEHSFLPKFSQRIFYSYQTAITGNELFKNVWRTVPRHKICYKLKCTPVENLSTWAMLSYFSSTHWIDYDNVNEKTCTAQNQLETTYYSTVNEAAVLDLQIQKWFWRRKLVGSLLTKNVWNQKYRYHPIGASFDLSFYIKLTYYFNFTF